MLPMCVSGEGGGGGECVFVYCLYYVFAFNPLWIQLRKKIYSIIIRSSSDLKIKTFEQGGV